nr:hypothetical protein [uncultured Desulfobacter sp.]
MDELEQQKEVEYYSAVVNAWFSTRMEGSKTLISLSAAAIGILVTLLTTIGSNSIIELLLFCFAILSFAMCCISVLVIFQRNSHYLESIVQGHSGNDSLLSLLDTISISSFILGIVFSFIIGINTGIDTIQKSHSQKTSPKEVQMTDESNVKTQTPQQEVTIKKSFNGASALRPQGNSSSTTTSSSGSSNSGGQSSSSNSNSSSNSSNN